MSDLPVHFDWTIDEFESWPPRGSHAPPFGPTVLEIMSSCPARHRFNYSKSYPRRMDYSARIGTAFHIAQESLTTDPPVSTSDAEVAEIARRRFYAELAAQDATAAKRPRERALPRDEVRIANAVDAIVVEAQNLSRFYRTTGSQLSSDAGRHHALSEPSVQPQQLIPVEVEREVRSRDGLFYGRIDRVEHLPEGVRLIDTKTALRNDVPDRYRRQLQLYAYLWYETYGEWPFEAELVYPFTSTIHKVTIDPVTCQQVAADYRALITRVMSEEDTYQLATPGETCKVCEFRPWCKPFWVSQAYIRPVSAALERANLGFEGPITALEIIKAHWKVVVQWRGYAIKIITPIERFPQLKHASVGTRIRCLDMKLFGNQFAPQAKTTEYSEIFILKPSNPALGA